MQYNQKEGMQDPRIILSKKRSHAEYTNSRTKSTGRQPSVENSTDP